LKNKSANAFIPLKGVLECPSGRRVQGARNRGGGDRGGFNEIKPEFALRASYIGVYNLQMVKEKKRLIFSF